MSAHMTKITIDGKQYPIRATMGALSEIQEAFGLKSIMQIDKVFRKDFDVNAVITIMEILLKYGKNENYADLAKQCELDCLEGAFNHIAEASGMSNPQKAPPKKAPRASRSNGKKPSKRG